MPKVSRSERFDQLARSAEAVAELAVNRSIRPVHVSKVETDHEIRTVLDAILGRWSDLINPKYTTERPEGNRTGPIHREHVVPRRVLVDRMIIAPSECRHLLEDATVLALVTPDEHRQLGHIWADHEALYAEMLTAPVRGLATLGLRRYTSCGITLHPIS